MPKFQGRRKRFYRRRSKARIPWYNRKYSPSELASKAYNGVKYLKGLINVEKHYVDVSNGAQNVDTTGFVTLLSAIAQGDDVNNRNGNSILAKTLYWRSIVLRDASNVNPCNFVRIMIIKDLENTGTAPTIADILASATVYSPLNVDHTSRYQVLADRVIPLPLNGAEGNQLKLFIPINDHLKFTGSASTDVYKNAIYVMGLSDVGLNPPVMGYNSRIGFYDN